MASKTMVTFSHFNRGSSLIIVFRPPGDRRDFMRACYSVQNHGDGTGTIVLDWYEISDGGDYCCSDVFMRVEIVTARQVVALLNKQLPGLVGSAPTEVDW